MASLCSRDNYRIGIVRHTYYLNPQAVFGSFLTHSVLIHPKTNAALGKSFEMYMNMFVFLYSITANSRNTCDTRKCLKQKLFGF